MGGTVPGMCRLVLKPTVLPITRAPRSSSGCTVHVTLNSETRQTSHVTKHTQHVVAIQIITCALERRPPWLHHQHHRRLLQISIIVSSSVSNITIITIIYSTLASERVWKALTS